MEGTIQENIGFYNLYDNPYVEASKQKIDILIGENLNELFFGNMEYLPENSIDLPNRFNIVTNIRNECLNVVLQHMTSRGKGKVVRFDLNRPFAEEKK
uniref:Uncharacterized protein n=1 Tax=Meloidogyne enterolobii TaxID=390850 RepID=A0A6V7XX36_MELEN|nr:unnamed protein product [Meloidogyne enterolobii]